MSAMASSVEDRTGGTAGDRLGAALRMQTIDVVGCDVRVWIGALDHLAARAPSLEPLLGREERERVAALRVPEAAARYCAGRATLRALLGAELGAEPSAITLRIGAHGKPVLDEPWAGGGLCFNVAHSADVVAVAFSYAGDVGVDIERRRPIHSLERLAERALSPGERALRARWMAEGTSALDAFLRAWTVKEARLKALGLPIGAGLSRDHPVARALPWKPLRVPLGADYFAAVAVSPARS